MTPEKGFPYIHVIFLLHIVPRKIIEFVVLAKLPIFFFSFFKFFPQIQICIDRNSKQRPHFFFFIPPRSRRIQNQPKYYVRPSTLYRIQCQGNHRNKKAAILH
jgi:hypothetical protein